MMLAMLLILSSFVDQGGSSATQVDVTQVNEAALRAAASVYPVPDYPQESIHALHTGRVAIEVVVAPPSSTSALATVRSSKVLETPDPYMANAVLESLKAARFMPFFDEQGVTKATGRIVWEFRITRTRGRQSKRGCRTATTAIC
jgi:outer membrane biosynthesis protein TonB